MDQSPGSTPSRALTIAQLVISIIDIVLALGSVIALAFVLITSLDKDLSSPENTQLINILFVIVAVIILTVPSLVSSLRYLIGIPPRPAVRRKLLFASLALLLVPLLILLGSRLPANPSGVWLSALISVLTILIPIWWFLEIGRYHLAAGSVQRQWGLSTFSIFITLPVIILVEIIVLGIGLVLTALWLVQQPEFAPFVNQFSGQFPPDLQGLENFSFDFLPLLSRPEVIAALLAAVVLVVPMLEELLKPLALWLLHRRGLTPAEGFTAGLICGAAFALLESLFSVSAVMPGDWLFTVTGRLGTGLLHIFTAGLNGWALASTWRDGRHMRVALIYILTVLIHGAWNFFAVMMGLQTITGLPVSGFSSLGASASWVLLGMALFMLIALVLFNRRLRRAVAPPPLPAMEQTGLE
ncbi:MAG TPA: PrsW family glutamic-type intramembrane protease [Anaerolineaceae bacterium]|nr:PrsW family glutamic-type intramembrane protease [Anaerolineaceae bacterium]